ncbi:MAG: hypothetical protein AB7H86_17895, partial [Blastocatellales bacterium]
YVGRSAGWFIALASGALHFLISTFYFLLILFPGFRSACGLASPGAGICRPLRGLVYCARIGGFALSTFYFLLSTLFVPRVSLGLRPRFTRGWNMPAAPRAGLLRSHQGLCTFYFLLFTDV